MNKFKHFKHLLLIFLFALASNSSWANNYSWFHFTVNVKAQVRTADGLVYNQPEAGSVYAKLSCNSAEKENKDEAHTHPSSASNVNSFSLDATLHAIPKTGYNFLYWTKEDGTIINASQTEQNDGKATVSCNATLRCYYGEKGSSDSNHAASHTSLEQQYGTYSNIFNYYAVFEEIIPSIGVASNNTNLGRAICSNNDNHLGDEVTLKAYCIDYDTKFIGWQLNGEIVSRDNPYTLTVTNTPSNPDETLIYTAVFENGFKFHRIRNYSTHNYLNAIDDSGSQSTLMNGGEITSLQLNSTDLSDLIYEAGSIIEIYYGRIPNDTRYFYDYYVQGAKASKYYDFDPDDPTSSTGGVFIRMPYDAKNYTNTWAFATANEGGMRFTDDNGIAKITLGERPESQWYIECIDKDLETCENYFSLDPSKLVQVGDDYYGTLRTSWNILFNPEQMTPYVVTSVNETDGTFEMEPITGNIIPQGTPVIIKTKSTDVEENRMVPTKTNAQSGAVPTGNLLQSSTKYFPNQSNSSNLKPLMVSNDMLTFGGTTPNTVNGNEAYLGVTNNVSLKPDIIEVTLAELLEEADMQKTYKVTDLTLVDITDNNRLLICKDNNGAEAVSKAEGEVDYMAQNNFRQEDHSNWVGLILPEGETATNDFNKVIKLDDVVGKLIDGVNPTMQLVKMPQTSVDAEFAPNIYIAASFGGTQHSSYTDKTYFFAQPRPMELAKIEWAQWNGTKFITPERQFVQKEGEGTWVNEVGLTGEFDFNGAYLNNADMSQMTNGSTYSMTAVMREKTSDYDTHVYVLGNVNGLGEWNPCKGVEMFTTDGVNFSTTLTVNNARDGVGFFGFTTRLAENNNDGGWDYIAPYRFGANTPNIGEDFYVFDTHYGNPLELKQWAKDSRAFRIQANRYNLAVNLTDMTLVITEANNSNNAPRRAGSNKSYVAYPLSMEKNGSVGNGVITGVANVKVNGKAVEVARYNVAGQRVRNDYHGIVIVLMSDGTAHKIVQ